LIVQNEFISESEYQNAKNEIIGGFYNSNQYKKRSYNKVSSNPLFKESYEEFNKFLNKKI